MQIKVMFFIMAASTSIHAMEKPPHQALQPKWGFSVGPAGASANMEDTHVALYPFADNRNWAFFGVYDGHGGIEAAQAVAKMFMNIL